MRKLFSALLNLSVGLPAFMLLLIGIVLIYSSSFYLGYIKGVGELYLLIKHLLRVGIGLTGFLIAFNLGVNYFKKIWVRQVIFFVMFGLLIGVLIYGKGGVRRWLYFWGFSLQPSEIARVLWIIYFANFACEKEFYKSVGGFLRVFIFLIFAVFLILKQPNVSMAFAFFVLGLFLFWLSGYSKRYLIVCLLFTVVAGFLYVSRVSPQYAVMRFKRFVAGEKNYQVRQASVAISSGGILGKGLGKGRIKLLYLPRLHTDFIFATIGEEMGFLGIIFVLLLYLFLFLKGIYVSRRCFEMDSYFEGLVVAGVIFNIFLSFVIHISTVLGFIPTTGMPLPFVSYGGSSLFANLFGLGLVLNVEKEYGL